MIGDLITKIKDGLNRSKVTGVDSFAFFQAAVLIPLVVKDNDVEILFEVRSKRLAWQPGEICFPGGRIDAADRTPVDAAVRETIEELGVTSDRIKVIGTLNELVSPIGVMLYPAVGLLEPSSFKLNKDEVADIFTVPLEWLINTQPDEAVMEMGTKPLKDFPYHLVPYYSEEWRSRGTYQVLFYKYENYVIWGLTAHILNTFIKLIK